MFRFFFVPVVFCWLFVWLQWRVTFNTPQSTPKTKTAKKKRDNNDYYLVLGQTGCARVTLRTCSPTTSATDNNEISRALVCECVCVCVFV